MSAIEKGSLILVTGANGFLATHTVEACLAAGYRVRGTARSAEKLANLQSIWDKKYGPGKFEVAIVKDMEKDGAFDDALIGVSGVAHLATIVSFDIVPAKVIDPVVTSTLSILRSCAAQPSVKSVALTSSSTAAIWPRADVEYDIGEDTWNEESLEKAYSLPDNHPHKPWHIYAASKMLGERAAWKFYNEQKPGFVMNAVLPSCNFGPVLEPDTVQSTASWVRQAFRGDWTTLKYTPPQWWVDVRDTALLHLHAMTAPELSSGGIRLWAAAGPVNVNDVVHVFRKLHPERSDFPSDFEGIGHDMSRIDNKRGTALLGKWRGLEDALRANTEQL